MNISYTDRKRKFKFRRRVRNQAELARRLGVSRQAVHQWINGVTCPSNKMIEKIRALEE